jgi:uncharacterized protein YdcH (DUF465 family)
MAMTVTEKDHFQKRLAERTKELTEDILNADTSWQRELVKEAVKLTEQHYHIQDKLEELKTWERRQTRVQRKLDEIRHEIVGAVRGMKPEHVSDEDTHRSYYGGPPPHSDSVFLDSDFAVYPGATKRIMQNHAENVYKQLLREHAVGKRLAELKRVSADFKDRLVACANHVQLSQVWKEVDEAFNIVIEETTRDRQLRKVVTTRNETTKAKK